MPCVFPAFAQRTRAVLYASLLVRDRVFSLAAGFLVLFFLFSFLYGKLGVLLSPRGFPLTDGVKLRVIVVVFYSS